MGRHRLLLAARICTKFLQDSQAHGQLQIGPSSLACQLHTAAVHALSAVWQPQPCPASLHRTKYISQPHTALQQHRLGPQLAQQQWTAAARFSTSQHMCSEEDLRIVQAEMSENEYHRRADETLDFLQEKLEMFVEDMDIDGADVEHAQGVLTVKLGSHGTYVINKQTPNQQIWLSSPLTGPFRYDLHEGSWVYHRDGRELLSQLQKELQQLLGSAPQLVD